MDLEEELRALFGVHGTELPAIPWVWESERWTELLFCILNSMTDDPIQSRNLIESLRALGLLEPGNLSLTSDAKSDKHIVMRHVLDQYGLDSSQAADVIAVLSRAAAFVQGNYDGKIQRYLRVKAGEIRDDLVSDLEGEGISDAALRNGVTHWLQNALILPLSVDDARVIEFCRSRGISAEDLMGAADALDLNLALVDDVIRIDAAWREAAGEPEP